MTRSIGKIETSRRVCQSVLMTVLAVGLGSACRAESVSTFAEPEEHPVTATLIAEHDSIQPGGHTRIAVHFEIEEGWHIYAEDPGDAGLPTKVTWIGPSEGIVFGPLQWPTPHEFLDPGDLRTFGYTGALLLSSTMAVPAAWPNRLAAGLRVTADVRWLACKDVCIPGRADLELVLPFSPDPPVPSIHAQLFHLPSDALTTP